MAGKPARRIDPFSTEKVSSSKHAARPRRHAAPHQGLGRRDGAFMEPSGRNR
jgi:hypothetical protein